MLGNPLGGAVYFRAISAFASYGTAQLPCKFTTFFRADHNTAIFFRHIRPSPFLESTGKCKEESIHVEEHRTGDNSKASFARWGLDEFKGAKGKKIGKTQLNKIVATGRKGESITNVEKNLKEQGIIEIL